MPVPCGQTTVSHELRITGSQQGISLLSIFHFHGCKKTKYAFYGKQAWCPPDNDTPISFWQLKAEVQSFFLRYCLFLQQLWFFQNIENGFRKYFVFLTNLSNENELSSSTVWLLEINHVIQQPTEANQNTSRPPQSFSKYFRFIYEFK